MTRMFQVGDICIGQNLVADVSYNGMECTIIAPLAVQTWQNDDGTLGQGFCYSVEWENGQQGYEFPSSLRLKRDDPNESDEDVGDSNDSYTVVDWAVVGWNPHHIAAEH